MAQVEAGRLANGRRRYTRATRASKADAIKALRDLQRQADAGVAPDNSRTVSTYLDWWADNVLHGTVKASTEIDYRGVIARWVDPHIGRAAKLDDALTADEAQRLIDHANGDRLAALVVLVLRLGLRRGEALALRWANVDLDAGELTVAGTLKYADGRLIVDTPKTSAGHRTLPLIEDVATALREHRKRQAAEQLAAGALWSEAAAWFTHRQVSARERPLRLSERRDARRHRGNPRAGGRRPDRTWRYRGDPGDLLDAASFAAELADRPAWQADALCREHPELTWHPGQGDDLRPALAVCDRCAVSAECLAYADGFGTRVAHPGARGVR